MVRWMSRRSLRVAVLAAGIAAMAGATMSAAAAVESGEYVYTEGGSGHGTLTIRNGQFTIETIGANGHTCELGGKLQGQTGVASDGADGTCRLTFSGSQGRLNIDTGQTDACRAFCGMRAMFDGEYRKAPATCTAHARSTRLNGAHAAYAKKQYADARDAFAALIGECKPFMSWIEIDSARSDLALAHYHLGENAQCLATLADTIAVRALDELPPTDADDYRSTGKAILFNEGLCKAAAARQ